jgi:phytoene dehydrogenase-like protein
MLITQFPRLARLDLDRNYFDTTPLVGTPDSRAFDLGRRAVRWQRRAQAWLGRDPRFYVRTMSFNHAGWRQTRAAAESARRSAAGFLRREALDRLLPRASVSLQTRGDPIVQSAPLKNVIGLLLWLRQHA